jgi:hypothetical protein
LVSIGLFSTCQMLFITTNYKLPRFLGSCHDINLVNWP